jgi:hypothetical protein
MADAEIVLVPNPDSGRTEIRIPTEASPSPESRRLGEALAVLADPNAEAPPGTMWKPTPSADARRAKWLSDVDDALDRQGITTTEWAGLLETFGRVGRNQGWFGESGQAELRALLRTRLGPGGRG